MIRILIVHGPGLRTMFLAELLASGFFEARVLEGPDQTQFVCPPEFPPVAFVTPQKSQYLSHIAQQSRQHQQQAKSRLKQSKFKGR